jgi:hypothetical protein
VTAEALWLAMLAGLVVTLAVAAILDRDDDPFD